MKKPNITSLYRFKELSGKHPELKSVLALDSRAGEPTYIDGLLEDFPNCAGGFEPIDENTVRLALYFFSDNPNGGGDEAVGSTAVYQGTDEIFLSQKGDGDSQYSIFFFRRGGYVELVETDSDIMLVPEEVDMEDIERQYDALAAT